MSQHSKSIFITIGIITIASGIAFAGSQNNITVFNILPLYAFCVAMAFVINWIAFIPAFIFQTEKFFDLTGSIVYITVTTVSVLLSPVHDLRTFLVATLIIIWTTRLGTFLFMRILKEKKDARFDKLKPSFLRYLNVWTLQGLWVTFTMAAGLVVLTTAVTKPIGIFAIVGLLVWIMGFLFEVVADVQKAQWRANPKNKGKFINIGLWSKSRHPNYFGEIMIWIGVALIALPVLQGWQLFTLISPVFVIVLLTRISGVPLLEKKADEKWGGMPDYEQYKKTTPVVIPKLYSM